MNFNLSIKSSNSPHFIGSLPFDVDKKKTNKQTKKKTATTLVPQPLAKLSFDHTPQFNFSQALNP